MEKYYKFCDDCEKTVELTEDGYCKKCGKHAQNMKNESVYNLTPDEIENYLNYINKK